MENKDNTNIIVIDSIMGSGKTSYAIQMMKANTKDKFIYITPFLTEVNRIREALPEKHFITPTNCNKKGSKLQGLKNLIQRGENIVSTHSLFKRCDEDIIELLKVGSYTLVMDECMDVVGQIKIDHNDFNILLKSNTIIEDKDKWIRWNGAGNEYNGVFKNIKEYCFNNNIYHYSEKIFLWTFPVNVFCLFKQVYILTYMFEGQVQKYYFDLFGIRYKFHSVKIVDNRFVLTDKSLNDNLSDIAQLLHIYEGKLNDVGKGEYTFSVSYFKRAKSQPNELKQIKNNIYNYFMHITKSKAPENMWTTYNDVQNSLKGKGYTKGFIACNSRATNEYRNKTTMAYVVNRFTDPYIKQFFKAHGIDIDEDKIALSELVQWVFRSAIRDGNEVYLYIPSERMRTLLKLWLGLI